MFDPQPYHRARLGRCAWVRPLQEVVEDLVDASCSPDLAGRGVGAARPEEAISVGSTPGFDKAYYLYPLHTHFSRTESQWVWVSGAAHFGSVEESPCLADGFVSGAERYALGDTRPQFIWLSAPLKMQAPSSLRVASSSRRGLGQLMVRPHFHNEARG